MARNERTSARIAKIAAEVLAVKVVPRVNGFVQVVYARKGIVKHAYPSVSWGQIRALAASALTQAPDRPRPADRARAAFRESIEATATSPPDDRPRKGRR